ncbi:MAG: UDP-N-acetylglucosamine 1-carboxyvinyltransferase [Melioribacteraceae bacterium]|nr:UDP-N-acetylglucosamine 1-carboxyvinyltransferase [Melioribacteraceae bacterium]MCF8355491.1 UDP-N-acetylglucosamine 1-carboxyvinyltransferase [Melioribacteraceae bacterium]MCF8394916.1 UDP-N-acetylglucosamine 1-carboxyvinyltransferase [Melioribacteraceae bacterium]MCF8420442.1 UDP-N-acetylglucosamine 1-carboxyvinyltransferase [Melioribacteraceae bacterium]
MDKFVIEGGNKLNGRVKVSGAKNSALALMPAVLLTSGKSVFNNIPEVNDIFTMSKLLKHLGVVVDFNSHNLELDASNITSQDAPYEHVKKMRASVYVLGPLLARFGYAKVSLPGGCAWGPRPINLHLEAMKKLGAEVNLEEGYIVAKAKKLTGAQIHFDVSSVGATGNAMMAASLAKGNTLITNAAIEPEITLLAEYLKKCGVSIDGIGTKTIEIEGTENISGTDFNNISDRIEAGTLLIAGAITNSNIAIEFPHHEHLNSLIWKLEETGAKLLINNDIIEIDSTNNEIESIDVSTDVYPGFPTDLQAQWTALMSLSNSTARVTDSIYSDRFKHVPELVRLGANIEVIDNSAVIKGVKELKGAKVMSTDLRASASLVLGGLAAKGTTEVLRIYHLDRGYQRIEEKLSQLGARIDRVKTTEF